MTAAAGGDGVPNDVTNGTTSLDVEDKDNTVSGTTLNGTGNDPVKHRGSSIEHKLVADRTTNY